MAIKLKQADGVFFFIFIYFFFFGLELYVCLIISAEKWSIQKTERSSCQLQWQ